MKRVNVKCAFIFMFVAMISFASENRLLNNAAIKVLGDNVSVINSKLLQNWPIITADLTVKVMDISPSINIEKRKPIIDVNFLNTSHLALRAVKYIIDKKYDLSLNDLFKNMNINAEVFDIFSYITKDQFSVGAQIATAHQVKTNHFDKIIVYNSSIGHTENLQKTIKNNAKQYEKIEGDKSSLDLSFIYDDFDHDTFMQHIKSLQKSQQYVFSMLISQGTSYGVAIFCKSNNDTVECIMINVQDDKAKELVKNISYFASDDYKFKTMIARFFVARYHPTTAKNLLNELGVNIDHPLYTMLDNNNAKIENENIKKLQQQFDQIQEKHKDCDQEKKKLNSAIDTLKQTITKLQSDISSKRTESRWKYGAQMLQAVFSKFSGGFILALGFCYWMFIKR